MTSDVRGPTTWLILIWNHMEEFVFHHPDTKVSAGAAAAEPSTVSAGAIEAEASPA